MLTNDQKFIEYSKYISIRGITEAHSFVISKYELYYPKFNKWLIASQYPIINISFKIKIHIADNKG